MCEAQCRLIRTKFRKLTKLMRIYGLIWLMKTYQLTQILTSSGAPPMTNRKPLGQKCQILQLVTRSLRRQLIP